MKLHSKAASCCAMLAFVVACSVLTGCSSSFNTAEYDKAAQDCNESFLDSMTEGQHVFIDPQLSGHEYAPISLKGVEQKLGHFEESIQNKVHFRVIAKQVNVPDIVKTKTVTPAQLLTPLVLERAKRSDSFPNDNYVLILATRNSDDLQSISVQTTCSPELLTTYSTLQSTIATAQHTAIQTLPNPLDEAVLAIARAVTDDVAQVEKTKAEAEEVQRKAQEDKQRIEDEAKRAEDARHKAPDLRVPLSMLFGALVGSILTLIGVAIVRHARGG